MAAPGGKLVRTAPRPGPRGAGPALRPPRRPRVPVLRPRLPPAPAAAPGPHRLPSPVPFSRPHPGPSARPHPGRCPVPPALRPSPAPPRPRAHLSSAQWSTLVSSRGPAARPPRRPGGGASPTAAAEAAARLPRAAPSDSHLPTPGNGGTGCGPWLLPVASGPQRPHHAASRVPPARLSPRPAPNPEPAAPPPPLSTDIADPSADP